MFATRRDDTRGGPRRQGASTAWMVLALVVLTCGVMAAPATPRAPGQPTNRANPGSNVYDYTFQKHTVPGVAVGGLEYYIPVPADARAHKGPYPVLVFAHGYMAYGGSVLHAGGPLDYFYTQLLRHVARKGYVVVFPQYQANSYDSDYYAAMQRMLSALDWMAAHVPQADMSREVWAGHSMGGTVTMMAAGVVSSNPRYERYKPMQIVELCPYIVPASIAAWIAEIDPHIVFTFLAGDADTIAPIGYSVAAYHALTQSLTKQVIEARSFPNENPPLIANHAFPMTRGSFPDGRQVEHGSVNALDWWMSWKIVVGALDESFAGGSCAWVWGSQRLDGGVDGAGRQLKHTLVADQQPPSWCSS